MKHLDKEKTITEALAKKEITLEEAAKLSESAVQSFSAGADVYVVAGIRSGTYGKFIKEANGGFYEIKSDAAGTFVVPAVFVIASEQR